MTSPDSSSGLVLHHVGYAVRDIPTAADTYFRCFGYTVASAVIHDPLQTALVQFLKLPGDPSWLELVAPDGPESKLARTVGKRGGLHHLCYTAPALEPTIAHLSSNGMLLFSDPQPAIAFDGRRICWLVGEDSLLVELVERRNKTDSCEPVSSLL